MPFSLQEIARLAADALRERHVSAMRKVKDRCISEVAVKFDAQIFNFALIAYVLSKIIAKPRYVTHKKTLESLGAVEQILLQCERHAKSREAESVISCQEKILSAIEEVDQHDKRYVKGLIQKGKLKIASTLYAQGISLGHAAEVTGTSQRELLMYAGQTMMFDRLREKKKINDRIKELREIFS